VSDPWRKAWLAQVDEPVIDPERAIIDPHHHLWYEYGPTPNPYLAADLFDDIKSGGHRIEQTVYIEAQGNCHRNVGPPEMRPVGETEHALEQAIALEAAGGPRIGGIVAYADLLRGAAIQPVIEAHIAAGQGRFRGIRQGTAFDPAQQIGSYGPPGGPCLGDLGFRAGVELVGKMGLTFDSWVYHPQIPDLTALARACPDTTIVFDHYGGLIGVGSYAGQRDAIFAQWRKDVAELARCPNVIAKLGGLAMPMNGFGWHEKPLPPRSDELARAEQPYFDHALACFGAARAMLESNFPADKYSASYRVTWNALKRLAQPLSESEKEALFRGTAMRVYRLS